MVTLLKGEEGALALGIAWEVEGRMRLQVRRPVRAQGHWDTREEARRSHEEESIYPLIYLTVLLIAKFKALPKKLLGPLQD